MKVKLSKALLIACCALMFGVFVACTPGNGGHVVGPSSESQMYESEWYTGCCPSPEYENRIDDSGHYYICINCGFGEMSYHDYNNEVDFDGQYHWGVCECGRIGEKGEHEYTLMYNQDSHWESCWCGATTELVGHSGGEATCKEQAICEICNQKYGGYADNHNYVDGVCTWCEAPLASEAEFSLCFERCDSWYGEGYEVTGYECEGEEEIELVIPDEYEGLPVLRIANNAFNSCEYLTNVIIGNNVESIDERAFFACKNLKSVYFPVGMTNVYENAFALCSNLSEVHISSLESWLNINFEYDNGLGLCRANPLANEGTLYIDGEPVVDLVIPNNITSVGKYSFNGCSSIKSVTMESVKLVYEGAFWCCRNLENVSLGKVEQIYTSAFAATGLKSVFIPKSVVCICESAFTWCNHLSSIEFDKDFSGCILANAFSCCASLKSIEIPVKTRYIGFNVFSGTNLEKIAIPYVRSTHYEQHYEFKLGAMFGYTGRGEDTSNESVPESLKTVELLGAGLYDESVSGCKWIETIIIGEDVTSVSSSAFDGCESLKGVYYKGTQEMWKVITAQAEPNEWTCRTVYYYSETEPTASGNYWHYDAEGNPVAW